MPTLKKFPTMCLLLAAISLTTALQPTNTQAADTQSQPEPIRQEIGLLLQAAQDLFKQQQFPEALAKIAQTDTITNQTDWEKFTIARMRAPTAARAGDNALAAATFEAIIATNRLPAPEQSKTIAATGNLYYEAKNYPKAIIWLSRARKDNSNDLQIRSTLIQAWYKNNDIAEATSALQAAIAEDKAANRIPAEADLKLLVDCTLKANDKTAYLSALEKLTADYPKKEYWIDILNRIQSKPGFTDHMMLDLYRLKAATVQLQTGTEVMDMAQLSLLAGFPAEAKQTLDQGLRANLLNSPVDAARQKQLRDKATQAAAADVKAMTQSKADASKAKEGTGAINLGYALVSAGQFDEGLALMQDGFKKGGIKNSEEAKLHLGIAYQLAGQKDQAIQTFSTVSGTDGVADLAQLWAMQIRHPLN